MSLKYEYDALEPYMSEETLFYHYGKHHLAYVTTLNSLIEGTEFEDMSLEDIIIKSEGKIFNNAAQIWNHNLFWNSFSSSSLAILPLSKEQETASERLQKLANMIDESFGGFEAMKETFKTESLGRFGSGWVWLVQK